MTTLITTGALPPPIERSLPSVDRSTGKGNEQNVASQKMNVSPPASVVIQEDVNAELQEVSKNPEQVREQFIRKASEGYVSLFPISEVRFTIFKDASSGKFVTRFTNMVDGTVTQIPEPELVDIYRRVTGGIEPTYRAEA